MRSWLRGYPGLHSARNLCHSGDVLPCNLSVYAVIEMMTVMMHVQCAPSQVCLLIDASSSMKNRLDLVKAKLQILLQVSTFRF